MRISANSFDGTSGRQDGTFGPACRQAGMRRNSRKNKAQGRVEPSAEELAVLSRVLQHYPVGTKLHFGAPVRCPQCGAFGMVGDVDHYQGVTSYFCMHCGIEWALTRRALRRAPDAPAPVPVGGLGP